MLGFAHITFRTAAKSGEETADEVDSWSRGFVIGPRGGYAVGQVKGK